MVECLDSARRQSVASETPSSLDSDTTFSPATRRAHTARRNSRGYRLGMDYLLVAHDPTLITLARIWGSSL